MTLAYNFLAIGLVTSIFLLFRFAWKAHREITREDRTELDQKARDLIKCSYEIREHIQRADTTTELNECGREVAWLLDTFAEICDPETLDRHRVRLQDALDDKASRIAAKN
jgi:hypothetical protein